MRIRIRLAEAPPRPWSTLTLFTTAMILSMVDRFAIGVLVEPLRTDLGLSDIQIGLLQGAAFSVFYAGFGLPLGRMADVVNRKWLIIAGLLLWSIATAASGLATGFLGLFIMRMAVGIGEASLSPSAISIFGDLFSADRFGKAVGIYQSGQVFGSGIAFLGVGAIFAAFATGAMIPEGLEAWRATFFTIGMLGVVLALLIIIVVREPKRAKVDKPMPLRQVIRELNAGREIYGPLIGLYTLASCLGYGFAGWTPAFLAREFGLAPGSAGALFGSIMLSFGVLGPLAAGFISDRAVSRSWRQGAYPAIVGTFALAGIGAIAFLTGSLSIVLVGIAILAFGFTASFAMAMIELQRVAPPDMRGMITALALLAAALAGISIGPLIVPVISKFAFSGELGPALALTCFSIAIASALLALAFGRRHFIAQGTSTEPT